MSSASLNESADQIFSANSGVGFELASQLLAKGSYHVLVGSRSPVKGEAAIKRLESRQLPGTMELLKVDMTDDTTIQTAVDAVSKHGKLDILVNNAAIAPTDSSLRDQMRQSFDTNVTGPAVLTEVLAPFLLKSTNTPRIINISSGAGSIARRLDTSSPSALQSKHLQYRTSKAALNMLTACHHVEYGPQGVKVFAYCPGFTQSNLSGMNTKENGARSAEESVRPLVSILEGQRDDEAGLFLNKDGIYPW